MEILKRKVLVVDDDVDWLDLIERRLKRFGVQVVRARDGVEAVSLLDKHDFDLVITDTNMPYMDGISLLKFIRLGFAKVPVIVFFSGLQSSPLSGEEVQKIGATAVLEKRDAQSHLDLLLNRFLSSSSESTGRNSERESPLLTVSS